MKKIIVLVVVLLGFLIIQSCSKEQEDLITYSCVQKSIDLKNSDIRIKQLEYNITKAQTADVGRVIGILEKERKNYAEISKKPCI